MGNLIGRDHFVYTGLEGTIKVAYEKLLKSLIMLFHLQNLFEQKRKKLNSEWL